MLVGAKAGSRPGVLIAEHNSLRFAEDHEELGNNLTNRELTAVTSTHCSVSFKRTCQEAPRPMSRCRAFRMRSDEGLKTLHSLPQDKSHQGHDTRSSKATPMPPVDLIVQTPRGSSIQKTEEGQFLVCDAENHCNLTRSLYLAEEKLKGMERGYVFPYATSYRKSFT